ERKGIFAATLVESDFDGCGWRSGGDPGRADQAGGGASVLDQVEEREGNVVRILRQRLGGKAACCGGAAQGCPSCGKVLERAQPTLTDHLLRGFDDGGEDAADAAALVADRAVGEAEIALLRVAVALEEEQKVARTGRL